MITDKNGYLWICTNKGVCRYNGYSVTHFNVSDGLPTDDIWELYEDRKGRIWLGNIANEIGYIFRGKYHRANLKNIEGTLYPTNIRTYGDGISFITPYNEGGKFHTFCYFDNDTIFGLIADGYVKHQLQFADAKPISESLPLVDKYGNSFYILSGKYIYRHITDSGTNRSTNIHDNVSFVAEIENVLPKDYGSYLNFVIGDNVLSYDPAVKPEVIYFTNLVTGATQTCSFDLAIDDYIRFVYIEKKPINGNVFYVVTKSDVIRCRYESDLQILQKYKIGDFVPETISESVNINTLHKSDKWNYCIGTTNYGVWIDYRLPSHNFKSTSIALGNAVNVGTCRDSISFWWDEKTSQLTSIDYAHNVVKYDVGTASGIKQISMMSKDSLLVLAKAPYLLVENRKKLIPYKVELPTNAAYTVLQTNGNIFLFAGLRGLWSATVSGDSVYSKTIDYDRYLGLFYDSLREKHWAYNRNKIIVTEKNNNRKTILNELNSEAINDIEWAGIDNSYGNVFLKSYDNLLMYDLEQNTTQKLFKHFRVTGQAFIFSYEDKLIVVWKYGILFSVIEGKMKLSDALWYPNSKNIKYTDVYGAVTMNNKIVLNTNKGVYTVQIPETKQILDNNDAIQNKYSVILRYRDTVFNLKSKDTITINPKERKVLFDIINPNGNGSLKYYYAYGKPDNFTVLNSNELNTSELFVPDNYYKLYLYAIDESWKSDVFELNMYIKPLWWQTQSAVKIIWGGGIILGLLILTSAVLLTRKIVLKAAERKQLNMEMELKSIYAQINPHFIFNSLSSALLLVSNNKMDDAYAHISKFSRLLRNYLKSSRNKYITIEEEVENLRNYIELQQARFKDRFDYEFSIDPRLNSGYMNIPSLLIQPFVENAINHGILLKQGKGRLKVGLNIPDGGNMLVCTIEDNGVGRAYSKQLRASREEKKASYGDLMIQDLISIFNRYEDMQITIAYTDKEPPESGTIVTIKIKSKQYKLNAT